MMQWLVFCLKICDCEYILEIKGWTTIILIVSFKVRREVMDPRIINFQSLCMGSDSSPNYDLFLAYHTHIEIGRWIKYQPDQKKFSFKNRKKIVLKLTP